MPRGGQQQRTRAIGKVLARWLAGGVRGSLQQRTRAIGKVGALAVALVLGCSGGCKHHGELEPPQGAPAWEPKLRRVFDDGYADQAVNLVGRAPNDVLDQRLFAARMGYASLILLVRVEQVWGRGRYRGRQAQYLDVRIEDVLMGELPRKTAKRHLVEVATDAHADLPASLRAQPLLWFVRWAPDAQPPYHHHLLPASEDAVAYVRAIVAHAKQAGVLSADGGRTKRGGKRKASRPRKSSAPGKTRAP